MQLYHTYQIRSTLVLAVVLLCTHENEEITWINNTNKHLCWELYEYARY